MANAQDSATVVPLGIPAVNSPTPTGPAQYCGFSQESAQQQQRLTGSTRNTSVTLQRVALDGTVTPLANDHDAWNTLSEAFGEAFCSSTGNDAWFTTTDIRYSGHKSLWQLVDGVPLRTLKVGDHLFVSGLDFVYQDGVTVVSSLKNPTIYGKFQSRWGLRTLAFSMGQKPQLIVDYGNNPIFAACATGDNLAAVVRFQTIFGAQSLVTRVGSDGLLWNLGTIPDLGNDGSQNTALRNLTYSLGCNADTIGFMIRDGDSATAWTINDDQQKTVRVFSGNSAGEFPISNIWGLSVGADGSVSFAMDATIVTPTVYGWEAIFKTADGQAVPVAREGIDFPRVPVTSAQPVTVGSHLLVMQNPTGGVYEVKQ